MSDFKCSIGCFSKLPCGKSAIKSTDSNNVQISTCRKPVDAYLRRIGVKDDAGDLFEGRLILCRVGIFEGHDYFSVCPYHRDNLGIYWRPKASCQYPSHQGKAKPYRNVSREFSRKILSLTGVFLPLGSGKFILNLKLLV